MGPITLEAMRPEASNYTLKTKYPTQHLEPSGPEGYITFCLSSVPNILECRDTLGYRARSFICILRPCSHVYLTASSDPDSCFSAEIFFAAQALGWLSFACN